MTTITVTVPWGYMAALGHEMNVLDAIRTHITLCLSVKTSGENEGAVLYKPY